MANVNYADNQDRLDRGELTLEECRARGATHAAYKWSAKGLGFPATDEQRAAYRDGYDAELKRMKLTGEWP